MAEFPYKRPRKRLDNKCQRVRVVQSHAIRSPNALWIERARCRLDLHDNHNTARLALGWYRSDTLLRVK